ncbi:LOW QUALITY PROTEIN: hypothetical protein QTO34_015616 [Cnephaeus nilssonii]|uniref:Hydroxysteroid 11-beta-dehydrogenase 1-like protein n=1 Tax=Cnephaeus nilssonii TaxID=3371016 RepID=A0AA40I4J1_CNENI|nr:LOW QUALITY PROTEIN: hypothetical protein QTO34_015616 [Eptesicus nilssonii]
MEKRRKSRAKMIFKQRSSWGNRWRAMKVLLLTGLGALFFAYYWADSFDPASLQGARVLLTGASAGVGEELAYHCARLGSHLVLTARTKAFLQKVVGNCRKLGAPKVFFIAADTASPRCPSAWCSLRWTSWVLRPFSTRPCLPASRAGELPELLQLTLLALPSLTDSQGSLVVVSSLLGRVPTSFSSPYSAAKFALDSFFGSLQRELHVQDVNVAITICVLGLQDRASAKEGVRQDQGQEPGVVGGHPAPARVHTKHCCPRGDKEAGAKAALAVIRGGATRVSTSSTLGFHVLCLLRAWLPHPRAWFIRQELNVTATAADLSSFIFSERTLIQPP